MYWVNFTQNKKKLNGNRLYYQNPSKRLYDLYQFVMRRVFNSDDIPVAVGSRPFLWLLPCTQSPHRDTLLLVESYLLVKQMNANHNYTAILFYRTPHDALYYRGVRTYPADPAAAGPIIWQTRIFMFTLYFYQLSLTVINWFSGK